MVVRKKKYGYIKVVLYDKSIKTFFEKTIIQKFTRRKIN